MSLHLTKCHIVGNHMSRLILCLSIISYLHTTLALSIILSVYNVQYMFAIQIN